MKRNLKTLTLLSGICSILLGVGLILITGFSLLFEYAVPSLWLTLLSVILLVALQVAIFLVALVIGIVLIVLGASEIRIATLPHARYKKRLPQLIIYSIFNVVAIVFAVFIAMIASFLSIKIIYFAIASLIALCIIFKILDYSVFICRFKKGKILIEEQETRVKQKNLETTDIKLEKDENEKLIEQTTNVVKNVDEKENSDTETASKNIDETKNSDTKTVSKK